jgi:iron complex transport system ATP-binding protein
MRSVVQFANAEDRFRLWKEVPRIGPHIAASVSQVRHFTGHASLAPSFKACEIVYGQRVRDAGQFEATRLSELFDCLCSDTRRCLLPSIFILTTPLLELQDVFVQRGSRLALNGLSLTIPSGAHVAILGPNGCGKSTLIKLIARECYPLGRPDTRLRILGQQNWNIFDLRSHLGIVSNDLMAQCTRDITGRELVLSGFFGSVGIWPNHHVLPAMEEAAEAAMARLDAGHLADRWLDELSSGEARRLLIARALIHNPSALLLDEPTTSLDLAALHEIREHLRALANSGVALLLVTHHLEDIIPEIDRVVLLRRGTVFADGPKTQILNSDRLSELFGITVSVSESHGFYHAW